MTSLVLKFGGSSVGSAERMRAVAREIAAVRARGREVAVVVSAMGDTTDRLLALAAEVAPTARGHGRELDRLLATGEQSAAALLALALRDAGVPAMSFTGAQAGFLTDGRHGDARIRQVRARQVQRALAEGQVPVVAGFQGMSGSREITTLGRGGSDTTAVALAVALGAQRCDIYTDVDGIYTADPRVVAGARRHDRLTYREAVLLTRAGAAVLHARAATLALAHRLPVRIRASPPRECVAGIPRAGTLIDGYSLVEEPRILGVAAVRSVHGAEGAEGAEGDARAGAGCPMVRITVAGTGLPAFGGAVAKALRALARSGIHATAVGIAELGLVLHVTPERADDTVRLLHDVLLGAPARRRGRSGAQGRAGDPATVSSIGGGSIG